MDYPAIIRISAGNKYGTGFLINETTIITAAHNITEKTQLSNRKAEILKRERYVPGTSGLSTESSPNPYDLALITLKPPGIILNEFEYIKLQEGQQSNTCIIVGYQEIHNYQTGANGPANKKTNGLYEYEMDTGKGQSGGPLLLSGTVQPIAIGVHIHGLIEKNKNYAAPITANFVKWVWDNSPA